MIKTQPRLCFSRPRAALRFFMQLGQRPGAAGHLSTPVAEAAVALSGAAGAIRSQ
jgi:hypothetical protein